jgi:arylsulfatase A-like enzyme/Tfp pilus assembly protein PilF
LTPSNKNQGLRIHGRRPARIGLMFAVVASMAVLAGVWWLRRTPAFVVEPDSNQNVLLVTIDTLRADALSSYGGPAQTPNLDRLASHGARFTFAHAHAVTTLPSHTSILTGQLPYEHGMRDNSGFRVRAGTATLATRLKALGFATGAFVGGFPLTKRFGLTPGFDVYDDQMSEMKGIGAVSMPERRADVVVSRAVDWIGKQHGRFFGWVHVFDAHSPYKPPDEYLRRYGTQPYYGEVAFVDHALGPLFERLATLARPTLVIVTADHGESLGEHGEATHGMFAYEATLHVPLLVARVSAGGPPTAGTTIDAAVRHLDLAPTVLEAVGASADPTLAGTSLRDVIRTGTSADRPAYFESMTYNLVRGWAPLRGVLVDRDKYIDLPIPELYDLKTDPSESQNTAARQPGRLLVLSNTLHTYDTALPHRPGQESTDAVAALRSLGYVSGSAPAKAAYTEADDPKRLVEIDRDLHTATDLFEDGKRGEAMALLERAIARRPDTADAYISLAHAHWEAGEPRAAIATLERALRNGAPDRDVRIRLGLYLAESGADAGRAIALLKDMPADDVEALNGLGVAYGDAGRFDDAIQAFTRLLVLDPTNGIACQNVGSMSLRKALAAKGDVDRQRLLQQAESYTRRAIDMDPSLPDAQTTMGVILASSGRKTEAIESWKRAVALDDTQFNALYNLWSELAAAGRHDEAVTYGRQFVATAPPAFFKPDIDRVQRFLGSGLGR